MHPKTKNLFPWRNKNENKTFISNIEYNGGSGRHCRELLSKRGQKASHTEGD